MTDNPFARDYSGPPPSEDRPEPVAAKVAEKQPLITEPGAYPGIDGERYHAEEICDGPSISSTGLKTIEGKSALHYWYNSPLNPDRPRQEQKSHFNVGKAVHDLLLLEGLFPKQYFILPEGYDGRLKKWADAKEEMEAAVESGVPVLRHPEYVMVEAIAEQVGRDDIAPHLLKSGQPEMTLAAKDPITGVWMRARPDVLPDTKDIIPDLKTTLSAHPEAFEKQATQMGYFQSAALYLDLIDLIYGEHDRKRRFILIVVEKEPPYLVQHYHLDDEAIQIGRMLNRRALNIFSECLRTGVWTGYSHPQNPILPLDMTAWMRARINRRIDAHELSWES